MSLKKRLLSNGIASAGSIAWSALIQLISVPALTHVWGVDVYGQWLMLITVPTYFALSDLGFTAAATSRMTMSFAVGDNDEVQGTFQSLWALVLGASVFLVSVVPALALLIGWMYDPVSSFVRNYGWAIYSLLAYSAGVLCSRAILAAFRSTGNYALGTIIYDAIQFMEGVAVIVAALYGCSLSECAAAYFVVRLLNVGIGVAVLAKVEPWIKVGFDRATKTCIKELVAPAFSAMAIPAALAINLQGVVLVAGYIIGPYAVAILGPVRTASRITIQLIGIVNRASMPEFSSAAALNDKSALRKIIRLNLRSIVLVLLPGAVVFGLAGSYLVGKWSLGNIDPPIPFVAIVALSMFVHGVWFFASNLLVSVNAHGRFGRVLLPVSVVGMFFSFGLTFLSGLNGLGISLVVTEFLILLAMLPDLKKYFFVELK